MTGSPEVSYVVLSYNYEQYIETCIRSILAQAHQDFEIVVVDDASTDRSCEIIEGLNDSRIRLIRNAANVGGAASYNTAVMAARGVWLSNLDADDWIAPEKTQVQLDHLRNKPDVAVIGSYVNFVGADGSSWPAPELHEAEVNTEKDLNLLVNWVGRNSLCRSSTMVRRSVHMELGLDDPTMFRAPDYELWTRFVRARHRIVVLPEKLTFYRLHTRGVTHGDPIGTFTEMCWVFLRNLKPAAESLAAWPIFEAMSRWVATHPRFADLSSRERERILGLFMIDETTPANFAGYLALIRTPNGRLETLGRRTLGMIMGRADDLSIVAQRRQLELGMKNFGGTPGQKRDVELYVEARDYWRARYDATYLQRFIRFAQDHRNSPLFRLAFSLYGGLFKSSRSTGNR